MATKKSSEAKKPSADTARKEALLKRAKDRFKILSDHWEDNRKLALEDIKFRAGEQWPENIKKERDEEGRPCLVLDKGQQYIRQVVNDGRQNRPSVGYVPRGGGDEKVANNLKGLVRALLVASNADQAFDTALDHAAGHGFGWFRVLTEYESDTSFNLVIRVERIRNALAVLLAPHQAADGSDAEDGFVIDTMAKAAFERQFPKAEKTSWKQDADAYGLGWIDDDSLRVCEYFYREEVEKRVVLLDDGTSVDGERYDKAVEAGVETRRVVRERMVKGWQVKWAKMTGAEILEEQDFPSQFIPLIPVYGTETDVEGKVTYSGLTRPMKDGQKLYNYARTMFAERVALTPRAPWVAAEGQTDSDPNWKTANTKNHDVLKYTPLEVNGQMVAPPQRSSATDIPAGYAQEMQTAEHDIQAAVGMYSASLGAPSNEKSGRAIIARQREGDVATFHYHDNLTRAIRYLGRILLDMIPRVYDTRRVVRLLAEDGKTTSQAVIVPELPGGVAVAQVEGMDVFTLGVGEYDVDVTTGPSYTTKRQEATEAMIEIAGRSPQVWATHGDIIVKAQDWPGADDWAKRTRALMPPEVKAAIDKAESEDEAGDPKIKAIIEAADAEITKRDQALEQAQAMLVQAQEAISAAQADAERAKTEAQIVKDGADIGARERVLRAEEAKALAEDQLRAEKLVATIQRISDETVEAVKAMAMPEPSVIQPEPVAPVGPSPEILALLDAFHERTEGLVRAVLAPRRRVAERDPATGFVTGFVDAVEEAPQPEGVI